MTDKQDLVAGHQIDAPPFHRPQVSVFGLAGSPLPDQAASAVLP